MQILLQINLILIHVNNLFIFVNKNKAVYFMMNCDKKYYKYNKKIATMLCQMGGNFLSDNALIDLENKMFDIILLNMSEFKLMESKNIKVIIEPGAVYLVKIPSGEIFNWNWSEIKKKFPEYMKYFYKLRKRIVDELINIIFSKYPNCGICRATSSGSSGEHANLMSDYDLTITGHQQVSKMIQIFNSVIFNFFGDTPFDIFDTNLYGYSFMMPIDYEFNNAKTWMIDTIDRKYNYLDVTDDISSLDQDKWAYTRLFTFLEETHNKYNIVMNKIDQNRWILENNINRMNNAQKGLKYIEKMKEFERIMEDNEDDKISNDNVIPEIQRTMMNTLSLMNYYGDETYFTQGSFIHVVGTMFYYSHKNTKQKMSLLKTCQLIHSMVENLAYFIHVFHKYGDIIISVKYMERFLDAFLLLKQIDETNETFDELTKLRDYTTFVKKNVRNLSNNEIFTKVKNLIEHQAYFELFGDNFISDPEFNTLMNYFKEQVKSEITDRFMKLIISEGIIIEPSNDHFIYGMLSIIKNVTDNHNSNTHIRINKSKDIYEINIE